MLSWPPGASGWAISSLLPVASTSYKPAWREGLCSQGGAVPPRGARSPRAAPTPSLGWEEELRTWDPLSPVGAPALRPATCHLNPLPVSPAAPSQPGPGCAWRAPGPPPPGAPPTDPKAGPGRRGGPKRSPTTEPVPRGAAGQSPPPPPPRGPGRAPEGRGLAQWQQRPGRRRARGGFLQAAPGRAVARCSHRRRVAGAAALGPRRCHPGALRGRRCCPR